VTRDEVKARLRSKMTAVRLDVALWAAAKAEAKRRSGPGRSVSAAQLVDEGLRLVLTRGRLDTPLDGRLDTAPGRLDKAPGSRQPVVKTVRDAVEVAERLPVASEATCKGCGHPHASHYLHGARCAMKGCSCLAYGQRREARA
jgi:hypothetical protein